MQKENFDFRSFLLYIIFGVATTAVNILCYYVCSRALHQGTMLSNIFAWILAVTFAYMTNRKWVFESRAAGFQSILTEMAVFFGCRFATGLLDMAVMFFSIDILGFSDIIMKVISNIIVILANYIASKRIIFKKRE